MQNHRRWLRNIAATFAVSRMLLLGSGLAPTLVDTSESSETNQVADPSVALTAPDLAPVGLRVSAVS